MLKPLEKTAELEKGNISLPISQLSSIAVPAERHHGISGSQISLNFPDVRIFEGSFTEWCTIRKTDCHRPITVER
jgi:hypothetical protein